MTVADFVKVIDHSCLLRIIRGNEEIYIGYMACFAAPLKGEFTGEEYNRYKDEKIKHFQAHLEITHKEWQERGLMRPLLPEETPDFSFSDLQTKLYYMIYLQDGGGD